MKFIKQTNSQTKMDEMRTKQQREFLIFAADADAVAAASVNI